MYKIYASSIHGTEHIDTASSVGEAVFLVKEYQLAFGPTFTIYMSSKTTNQ